MRRIATLLLLSLLPSSAIAKTIQLSWDAVEDAAKYELVIEQAGKPVLTTTVERSAWKGEIGPGFHAYRIRAVDTLGRPGEWSDPLPVVVMPSVPEPLSPKPGEQLSLFMGQEVALSWKAEEGYTGYLVELKRGDEVVYSATVSRSDVRLGGIPAGEYSWQVKGVVAPDAGYPGLADRNWFSQSAPRATFSLARKSLTKPILIYPIGEIWPSSDGKIDFKWEQVPGALAYEVKLQETLSQDQVQNGVKAVAKIFRSEENGITLSVGKKGKYAWKVAALPSSSATLDAVPKGTGSDAASAGAWPESEAEFALRNSELSASPPWEVGVETGYSFLALDFTDTTRNIHGQVAPQGVPLRLGAQRWWSRSWGLDGHLEPLFYGVDGTNQTLLNFRLDAQYQQDLSFGWNAILRLGVQGIQAPILSPQQGGSPTDVSSLFLLEPGVSLEVDKSISGTWSAQAAARLSYPLVVFSNGASAALGGSGLLQNPAVSAGVIHLLNASTAYRLSLSWERSSASWASAGNATSNQSEAFRGASLLVGLVYHWGGN